MISRKYFYSGYVARQNASDDYYDGIIVIDSWFPNPVAAYQKARKNIEKHSRASTVGQRVVVTQMNRI